MNSLNLIALEDIPFIKPGDDIAEIIFNSINKNKVAVSDNDIFVIAQKIISKSENRYMNLDEVETTKNAEEIALKLNKDPRLVQTIINESNRIISIPNHKSSIIQSIVGSFNGFIIGLTSIYTMPFVFLLQSLKYDKEKTVQFMGLAFLLYSLMQFFSFIFLKLIDMSTIIPSLIVSIPVVIGFFLGKIIRGNISEILFKKLFYIMLLLMSGVILINGVL